MEASRFPSTWDISAAGYLSYYAMSLTDIISSSFSKYEYLNSVNGASTFYNSTAVPVVYNATGNSSSSIMGSDDGATDDYYFKPGGSYWARNGYYYSPSGFTPTYLNCVYVTTAISFIILYHSWRVNGPLVHSVRVSTDFSAVMAILSFAVIVLLLKYDQLMTLDEIVVLNNVFYNTIFNGGIQIADNYMFLLRYESVQKMSVRMKIGLHLYIWFVLLFSWTVLYWLLPLFYNMNSDLMTTVSLYCQWLSSIGAILFNLYFTFQFASRLRHARKVISNNSTSDDYRYSSASARKMQIMLIKNIGHCITSTLGYLLYTIFANNGSNIAPATQNIINVVGLHLWFNSKIERRLFPSLFRGTNDVSQAVGVMPSPRTNQRSNINNHKRSSNDDVSSSAAHAPTVAAHDAARSLAARAALDS